LSIVAATRPKLAAQVAERLLSEIWSGRWQPGDRLPTEPEMVALFGVSRTPVREAMQSLRLLGVVDISPRRGATVRALPVESVMDVAVLSGVMAPHASLSDVFEFRHSMESAVAALAARRATAERVNELRSLVAGHAAAIAWQDHERAQQLDLDFHIVLAESCGNAIYHSLARALTGLFIEIRRLTSGIPGAPEAAVGEHQAILAAIAAHDAEQARRAAARHIRQTRARYEHARRSS
jgi:GntR family transcriptional repressor for pyruvate dehydrogenase complex